ncbi:MAG: 1-deoxy-D-xylulose-5-phosphate synthase [Candidatus Poribacteria bacterium]|nr:1-deoxy-D-xylulose-5-phosphate synthase [Candidatus Poribacteria bacterium]
MLLEKIDFPSDLKSLNLDELKELAEEMRGYLLSVLSEHPGHFAPNLGTVELAIALHYVFNTPHDQVIWDIGHQAYPHKLLTGRRAQFPTLRQYGGISGFLSRAESEYDVFGAGHSSTSLAAALGIAAARDLNNGDYKVISVIGDGGLTGGMAFEAMNAAGDFKKDMIVVLNDNQMSISATVGAFSKYFNRLVTNPTYNVLRSGAKELMDLISPDAKQVAKKIEAVLKPGTLFEEFGFRYFGPLDGNDLEALLPVLEGVKALPHPILVHVVTKKGKGYLPAEADSEAFYSVSGKFDLETGKSLEPKSPIPKYTDVFSETLIELAREDSRIVGITAAMPNGTGLDKFQEVFPRRFFDVGLAEQCAVTFAAGLATQGMKPVAAIYSTFLQRTYDQLVHDVCIQNLPVTFALDRAGLVGADGPTHHGVFDFAYLRHLPNMVVMAPKDEDELQHMVKTAVEYEKGPIAFRYPRGTGVGVPMASRPQSLPIGRGEVLRKGGDLLILAIGNRVHPALEAAEMLADSGVSATVVNARFVKPLDEELILPLAEQIGKVITIEDGVRMGGFGSAVVELFADRGFSRVQAKLLGIPDQFIEHGDVKTLYHLCGLDADAIVTEGLKLVKDYP